MAEEESTKWTPKNILLLLALLLVVVVVGFNLAQGVGVKKIDIPGFFSAEFGDLKGSGPTKPPVTEGATEQPRPAGPKPEADVSSPFIPLPASPGSQVSQDLAARIEQMEKRLAENQKAPPATDTANAQNWISESGASSAIISVAGNWQSEDGLSYVLVQSGGNISFQEMNPLFGATAEGGGVISGNSISLVYQTALGTNGKAVLNYHSEEDVLTGSFTDLVSGATLPIRLSR